MDRTTIGQSLKGGYIEEYDFDMRRNRVTMRVDVLENEVLATYDVRFEKVSHFSFDTESLSTGGDRLELTELWVDTAPETSESEEWAVTISMWDMTHIVLRCSLITIDGSVLR
jgi:hypothetical protein